MNMHKVQVHIKTLSQRNLETSNIIKITTNVIRIKEIKNLRAGKLVTLPLLKRKTPTCKFIA